MKSLELENECLVDLRLWRKREWKLLWMNEGRKLVSRTRVGWCLSLSLARVAGLLYSWNPPIKNWAPVKNTLAFLNWIKWSRFWFWPEMVVSSYEKSAFLMSKRLSLYPATICHAQLIQTKHRLASASSKSPSPPKTCVMMYKNFWYLLSILGHQTSIYTAFPIPQNTTTFERPWMFMAFKCDSGNREQAYYLLALVPLLRLLIELQSCTHAQTLCLVLGHKLF